MQSAITIATGAPRGRTAIMPATSPVYLTADVLLAIARTVGSRRPETGGMLFGLAGFGGCDVFEFDEVGSRAASAVVYRPDVTWANARQEHQIRAKPMRLLDGFVHSHPGNAYEPSQSAGGANGDLGFAAAAFEANDHLDRFLLPIVTKSATLQPILWPWVCERTAPHEPLLAPVVIAESETFPSRRFPPEHAARFGAEVAEPLLLVGLQLDRLSEYVGLAVICRCRVLAVRQKDISIEVHLPLGFPAAAPTLLVETPNGRHVVPVRWASKSLMAVESRLGRLISNARVFAQEV